GIVLLLSLRGPRQRTLELIATFLGVTVAVNLPFAIWGWPRWTWFFEYNRIREIEPSLYLLLGADARGSVTAANTVSAMAVLAAGALWAATHMLRKPDGQPHSAISAITA